VTRLVHKYIVYLRRFPGEIVVPPLVSPNSKGSRSSAAVVVRLRQYLFLLDVYLDFLFLRSLQAEWPGFTTPTFSPVLDDEFLNARQRGGQSPPQRGPHRVTERGERRVAFVKAFFRRTGSTKRVMAPIPKKTRTLMPRTLYAPLDSFPTWGSDSITTLGPT